LFCLRLCAGGLKKIIIIIIIIIAVSDGSGLLFVSQTLLSQGLAHPFGIAVHSERIYWSDWDTHSVEMADKLDGSRRQVVYTGHDDLFDVHVFNRQRPTGAYTRAV